MRGGCLKFFNDILPVKSIKLADNSRRTINYYAKVHRLKQVLNRFFSSDTVRANFCQQFVITTKENMQ